MSFAVSLDNAGSQYLSARAANKFGAMPLSTSSLANVEATAQRWTNTQWLTHGISSEAPNSLASAKGRTKVVEKASTGREAFAARTRECNFAEFTQYITRMRDKLPKEKCGSKS